MEIWWGTLVAASLIALLYTLCGLNNIVDCYRLWIRRSYWTPYNIVEGISWGAKAIIIVPGLVFGYQLWWAYWITLITSLGLIWASNRKLLPTLVGFNSLWVWISCVVLARNLLGGLNGVS